MSESPEQVKVLFRVENEDGSVDVETLWAHPEGDDNFRIDNFPYFAYGVSWNDLVYAPMDKDDGFPTFRHVVKKSGNRTVRIIFDPPVEAGNQSDEILNRLVELGCEYEGANRSYVVINIPPEMNFESAVEFLINTDVAWEHADPAYDSLYQDEAV